MPPLNSYGDLTQDELGYARGKALERAQSRLLVTRYGFVDPQPLNQTRTRMWVRWNRPAVDASTIAEGTNPSDTHVTSTIVQVTLDELGASLPFTNRQWKNGRDNIIESYSALLGEMMAEKAERYDLAHLVGGTNVMYAGTSATTRATVAGPPTLGGLRVILRSLKNAGAREIKEAIKPSALISTSGVEPGFVAWCHPNLESDIREMRHFKQVMEYGNPSLAEHGEIGSVEGVRFITTDLLTPWLAAATSSSGSTYLTSGASGTGYPDVYPILIFGKNAYATVPLSENRPKIGDSTDNCYFKINVITPKPQISDKLGLNGAISALYDHACGILNQAWMIRWEVACTALPSDS